MLRNIGSNWVLIVLTVALSYVTTPFIVETLGKDGYGTWTLVNAITGYISLVALGVPAALVRYLAQHVRLKDWAKANETIGTCAGLYLMLCAAAFVVGSGLGVAFMAYDIPVSYRADAYVAFGLMVIYVSISFVGLLPEGIMFSHHDFVPRNLVRVGTVLLRFALTIGVLRWHPSLSFLAAIQLIGLSFDFLASWTIIRFRYPEIRLDLRLFNRATLRQVLSFSLFVLLMAAGGRLSFETDALVIGALLSVSMIPFYAIANSLVVYLVEFIVGIAAVVAPMTTALWAEGRRDELREMFLKWSKVALSLTIAAGLFLMVLGPRFIGWWIDHEYEGPSGGVLRVLMASCFVFLPARGVALPVLMGLGKPGIPTIAFLAAGVLNLIMSAALARPLGLVGVALGTAIPNVMFAILIVAVACRELNITLLEYGRYVVPRAAVGALPTLGVLLWFKAGLDVSTVTGLVTAGIVMMVVWAATWVLFVYRDDPYVDVRSPLARLWSRA